MYREVIVGVDPEHLNALETVWWSCTARGCAHKRCDRGHVLVLPHEVSWRPYLASAKGLPPTMFKDYVSKGRVVKLDDDQVMIRKFAPVCREGACLDELHAWQEVRELWNTMNGEQRVDYVLAVRAGLIHDFPLAAEDFWEVAQLAMPEPDWDQVVQRERPWNPELDK